MKWFGVICVRGTIKVDFLGVVRVLLVRYYHLKLIFILEVIEVN